MSLTAKPTYRKATCAGRQTMSRRDREKAARASATAARPSNASKLQAIVEAWDAWDPDSWNDAEKWIQGCNAVEAAIEAARTDVPNARTEANWLVEGLKDARREAEARPELRERVVAHPSGFLDSALSSNIRNAHAQLDRSDGRIETWLTCAVCGEEIEGTENLTDEKANGCAFKCACGQEYVGSTRITLHAIEAARAEIRGGK